VLGDIGTKKQSRFLSTGIRPAAEETHVLPTVNRKRP